MALRTNFMAFFFGRCSWFWGILGVCNLFRHVSRRSWQWKACAQIFHSISFCLFHAVYIWGREWRVSTIHVDPRCAFAYLICVGGSAASRNCLTWCAT